MNPQPFDDHRSEQRAVALEARGAAVPSVRAATPVTALPRIPAIIHLTVPAKTTAIQERAIERARALHPGWRVIVWQDPIPPETFELAPFWDKVNSGAQLADLIRIEVVYRFGGIYVDSDLMLEQALDPLRAFDFFIASEDGSVLTNAVFGASPRHPALRKLIDSIADDDGFNWQLEPVHTTGPGFFSRELKWRTDVTVLPRSTFYPYNWNERQAAPHKHTYGVHLWEKSWAHVAPSGPPAPLGRKLALALIGAAARARRRLFFNELGIRFFRRSNDTYAAAGVVCARTIHGFRIFLSGTDVSVTPDIAMNGYYELREELFLRTVVKGGDWAIDVGANVGVYTLLLAQLAGAWGRVFAYEPNPQCRELLARSLAMNWVHDRVVLKAAAVGSAPGETRLSFNPESLGGATVVADDEQGVFAETSRLFSQRHHVRVPVVALDDEFPVDLPIRFLKIDTEGFEHEVLAGAKRLIQRGCIDFILLEAVQEVSGPQWPRLVQAMRDLEAHGYRAHRIRGDLKLEPVALDDLSLPATGRNLVFASATAKR
jgi:FkbM family methyltransferase